MAISRIRLWPFPLMDTPLAGAMIVVAPWVKASLLPFSVINLGLTAKIAGAKAMTVGVVLALAMVMASRRLVRRVPAVGSSRGVVTTTTFMSSRPSNCSMTAGVLVLLEDRRR